MMNETSKIAAFAAEMTNVASQLIAKKGAFVVFQLSDEAMALSTLDVSALKAEWAGKDIKLNVDHVAGVIKTKLNLEKKDVQAKIGQWLDVVSEGIVVATAAESLVSKIKALV